jgi:hypothetical protein
MLRSFAIGTFILAIVIATWYLPGHILWLVPDSIKDSLEPRQRALLSAALCWLGLMFAGFVTSALAPRANVRLATLLALPATALLVLNHLISPLLGVYVDLQGSNGVLLIVIVGTPMALLFCSIGGLLGSILGRSNRHPLRPLP